MATQHQTAGGYRQQWGNVGGGHQHGHPTAGGAYYQQRYSVTQAVATASTAGSAASVAAQQQQASYTPSSTVTYNHSNSVSLNNVEHFYHCG